MRKGGIKVIARVRCETRIKSQRIEQARSRRHYVFVQTDIAPRFRLLLPIELFGLIAQNLRHASDRREWYDMEDGRRVCKHINGKRCRIVWEVSQRGDEIHYGGHVLEILE